MASLKAHVWTFRSQFRGGAFGWRSDLPIKRIKEAVAEIKKAARKDKVLGAEGAVIFLEKVSGALAHVDSSSGAIGTAVNRAIDTLAPIVSQAPASDDLRDKWLERLWCAIEDDEIPYIAQNHRKCTAVFIQDAQAFSSKVHTHFHESAHSRSGSADARRG